MISIEDTQDILEEIAEGLPEIFFEQLNGGILLLPEAKRSPEALEDDLYILGEYCEDPIMGRYINIYYGSFEKLFAGRSPRYIKKELRETLLHEFTHHLESLAGERDLEIEDEWELQAYLESHEEDKKNKKK